MPVNKCRCSNCSGRIDPPRGSWIERSGLLITDVEILRLHYAKTLRVWRERFLARRDDGWTAVSRDKSLSAQFEHSVGVTETGVEIFTQSPKGLNKPPYA